MAHAGDPDPEQLQILHCFRSPVGGIFRHVRDPIQQQAAQGHKIGVICDNNTGGDYEEELLSALNAHLELGLYRLPMSRSVSPRDIQVMWKLYREIRGLNLDVLHAHGAKGGAYARVIGSLLRKRGTRPVRLYCPHGGSVHYNARSLAGRIYFGLERVLERFTDRLIFVSSYEQKSYFNKIGTAHCPHSLVYNGLNKEEFAPVLSASDAHDFVYVGMMRDLKGVDLFLQALQVVAERLNRPVSATLVGDGPDLVKYRKQAEDLSGAVTIKFCLPMPARDAFRRGQTLVVPSRAESMPYIVLEAIAASRPLIATSVGGIPEIFAEHAGALVEPDSLDAIASAMAGQLSGTIKLPDMNDLRESVQKRFSAEVMSSTVMDTYRQTLAI